MDRNGKENAFNGDVMLSIVFAWLLVTLSMWGFALYPTSISSPDWLIRAKAVCFGTDSSGLPDTYGWWLLTLAPLSLLIALVAAFPGELKMSFEKLQASKLGKIIIALALLLSLSGIGWATSQIKRGMEIKYANYASIEEGELPEFYPATSEDAPLFSLQNQRGENISIADFKGKTVILSFAFAHCQTVCPAIVKTGVQALSELPSQQAELVLITLDPWRDTPAALPSLAKKWSLPENGHILSGSIDSVNEAIKQYKIPTDRSESSGDISHPALVYIIGPDSKITYTFNNPSSKWITEAVRRSLTSTGFGYG